MTTENERHQIQGTAEQTAANQATAKQATAKQATTKQATTKQATTNAGILHFVQDDDVVRVIVRMATESWWSFGMMAESW
jgi:hypothetical protein